MTEDQSYIIHCITQGYTNKQIAQDLNKTEKAVRSHLTRIYKKHGVKNRLQLALKVTKA